MIHIFTTGGTIEGLDYEKSKNKLRQSKIAIREILASANVSTPYLIEKAFAKDSRSITEEDRKILVEKIKTSSSKHILITHGTYTMEDTATYFGKQGLDKIIVLVGSFIMGNLKNTDAPFNLGFAICSFQFLNPGVYVAMNGTIFPWNNVTKDIEANKFIFKNGK